MANDRKYEPVRVEMIGLEHGCQRFSKDGIYTPPRIAKWRNNLTALSQYHNLFFIAQEDCIAVYQPDFPFQTLRSQHALLLKPELANEHAMGMIASASQRVPHHSINHLVVGELGSQEVLVITTDSGNVAAYHTTAIVEAVNRAQRQSAASNSADVLGLRPFFSHWLRQSAWGIAFHKEARMLALSSNTPNAVQPAISEDSSAVVTVFAFALSSNTQGEADRASSSSSDEDARSSASHQQTEWVDWIPRAGGKRPHRDRNYKITLAGWSGHENNIPNISFVNTSHELEDTWLLSTDITGVMKLWQVWNLSRFREWFFGSPENAVRPWFHQPYPGWNVVALDIRCFRPAKSNEEFIGANKAPMYYGFHDQGPSYNLTPVVTRLPGNSQFHPTHPDLTDQDPPSGNDEIYSEEEDENDEEENDFDEMEDVQSPADERPLLPDAVDTLETSCIYSREIERFDRAVEYTIETDSGSEDSDADSDEEPDVSSPGSNLAHSPPPPEPRMQRHIRRQVTPIQLPNIKTPEIAMIHCSDSHIRLLASPKARFPHMFCANINRQILPHDVNTHQAGLEFQHMDRLNMLHVIEDLGVLLVATQTGRVAVCALTRHPNNLLGFRVDWILPTKKQERIGRRPTLCALVGMALAPVQGRSSPPSPDDSADEYSSTKPISIDGVESTFDNTVVVLRHPITPQERHAWSSKEGIPPEPKTETRLWKGMTQEASEEWRGIEVSRRYRLMLTYSDLSVLTYEIARGVERGEVAS